jgi:hypothetical protein
MMLCLIVPFIYLVLSQLRLWANASFLAALAAGMAPGLTGVGMIPARAAGCAANRAPQENFAHLPTTFPPDMWAYVHAGSVFSLIRR